MFLEEELIIEEWFLKWMEKEFTVIPASIDELCESKRKDKINIRLKFLKEFEYDFARKVTGWFSHKFTFLFKKNELDVRLSLIFKKFHLYGFRLWISNRKPWSSSNILYTISFPFEIFPLHIYIYPIDDIKYISEYILNASL